MKYYLRIFFLLAVFYKVQSIAAKDTLYLSLSKAIEMAQAQSPAARFAQMAYKAAKLDYAAFQASRKPALIFSSNLPGFNRSIVRNLQDDGSYTTVRVRQASASANLSLSQQLSTGGNLSIGSSTWGDFNFAPNNFTNWSTNLFAINYSQPIFQVNRLKWEKKATALEMKQAKLRYITEKENIAVEICEKFFSTLIAQENVSRAMLNVVNNDTIFRISQGRFTVGKIAENELLQSELNLMQAQSSLESASLNLKRSLQAFKTTLGLKKEQAVKLLAPTELPQPTFNPDRAVAEAMQHSEAWQSIEYELFQADQQFATINSQNRPNIRFNATFGLNQNADQFSESLRDPLERQAFSMQLELPVFDWGKAKAEKKAGLIRHQQTVESIALKKQNLQDKVYYQVVSLQQFESQMKIQLRSDEIAQKRYDITRNRYLVGKIDIQTLYEAQIANDAARANLLQTLQGFWIAHINLRAATLFDFVEMQSLVEGYDE